MLHNALLVIELTILAMLALWQHGVITDHVSRTSSDFVSFAIAWAWSPRGL